jgi:predicted permease
MPEPIFEAVVVALYAAGVLMSLAFVVTWYPLAFQALRHRRKDVSFIRIVDYAGLHLFVALAFALILRTFFLYGLTPPQDAVAGFSRLLLPLGIDILVGLRLYKWGQKLWDHRHGATPGSPEALESVSKEGSWSDSATPEDAPPV